MWKGGECNGKKWSQLREAQGQEWREEGRVWCFKRGSQHGSHWEGEIRASTSRRWEWATGLCGKNVPGRQDSSAKVLKHMCPWSTGGWCSATCSRPGEEWPERRSGRTGGLLHTGPAGHRTPALTLRETGSHGTILNRGVTRSDLLSERITLAAWLRRLKGGRVGSREAS